MKRKHGNGCEDYNRTHREIRKNEGTEIRRKYLLQRILPVSYSSCSILVSRFSSQPRSGW